MHKQNSSGGKLSALEAEPGSPKVSCMGKILSEKPKGPSQLCRKSKAKKAPRSAAKETPAKTEHKVPGCLSRMARILCGSKKRTMDVADESIRLDNGGDFSVSARISFGKDIKMKGRISFERDVDAKETVIIENERDSPVPVPVPGIGGIKRFASGRKVECNFEAETDNFNVEKEGKSLEKDVDVKERSTLDHEKDTPVPVLVLGLGGLKRFASGRKVDWNYETETDGGNFVKDESNENNKLENNDVKKRNSLEKETDTSVAVPVLGSIRNKFTSGRKLDWNFEVEDGGCMTKEEAKESNPLEKSDDNKKMNTFEKEIGTQLPVPVLGIGMMKRFPSGRKVEWSFELDTHKGYITNEEAKEIKTLKKNDDGKEKDPLVAVSVPEIGTMKRFASGRKLDWDFEMEAHNTTEVKEMKILKKDDDAKVTNTVEKEKDTAVVASLPRIGSMKRFASGRKVDWNFEIEFDNADEAKENDTLQTNIDAKENNILKKETDAPVTVTPPGIGGMRKFKLGRKLDRTFEVKGARQKSGMK